jgi:hypothetical protein
MEILFVEYRKRTAEPGQASGDSIQTQEYSNPSGRNSKWLLSNSEQPYKRKDVAKFHENPDTEYTQTCRV